MTERKSSGAELARHGRGVNPARHIFPLSVLSGSGHALPMDAAIKERVDEFIRRKGLRRTGQRDQIIESAFSKDEHFTAEELFDRVRKSSNDISRATVYRTLALLVEADLLREIDLGDNQTTYDPNFLDKPSHNHLVCIDCGRVVEFEDAHIDLLNDCVTRRLGFRPVRQTLKIEASCAELRLKGRCPNLIASRLSGKRLRRKR
jgi:Fur family ferric uptake transcriptional regulator